MRERDLLIVGADHVREILEKNEAQVIAIVRAAYEAHGRGESSLPHSTFLTFPGQPRDRIIALPAFMGADINIAGVKWVASFPGNLELGMDRASAVVVLSSAQTGRPEAILEGSLISARRTAASAALAAQVLHTESNIENVGLIGCGPINFEVLRFLKATFPAIQNVTLYDTDRHRAEQYKREALAAWRLSSDIAGSAGDVLRACKLVSFATTAIKPHVNDISGVAPGTTVLHVSLRDLTPEVILACDNVADDIDHVCRAQTSVHLAEQLTGNRGFMRCNLADVLSGSQPSRKNDRGITVFSPFGLGILDLAVAKWVRDGAVQRGFGTVVPSFLTDSWTRTRQPHASGASPQK